MSASEAGDLPPDLPPVHVRCESCRGTGWLWSEFATAPGQRGEWRPCRACPGTGRVDGKGAQRPCRTSIYAAL